jgi:xylan 1,4-beta-xylosidase
MKENKSYVINKENEICFHNNVDFCVGTGRMGLALQQEYLEQLKLVQEQIGFRYIRGHGLFCDDMAIYQEYTDHDGNVRAEYNFTYLDMVMDSYQTLGIRPFLELGFMPYKMASGSQTIFYWKGNTTPPKNYNAWCDLVQATLQHLMERYGVDEVVQWPIEVWNEPNLPGFWEKADMAEYFKLFEYSIKAIKEIDVRFRVGGPAICGVMDELWIRKFMEFCQEKNLPLDFVTRHHYTTEFPEPSGHYGYAKLSKPEDGFANLKTTRDIIDEFEQYKGMEIHITEFNTSYIPNCPLHDTNRNAAYLALQLSRLGDVNESYSYWTFGDIFEEQGVPFTPFHGGFGLVANGCIPKPTFYTFRFFKELQGICIHRSDDAIVIKKKDGSYAGIAWNLCMEGEEKELLLHLQLPLNLGDEDQRKEYCLLTQTVDEEVCNPLKIWHDMGEPSSLTKKQKKLLKESARPLLSTDRLTVKDNHVSVDLTLNKNGVIYFEIDPISSNSDRGYSYERAVN